MQQRNLGRSKLRVGEVGLGCWSFGGAYGPTDMKESHEALKRALDLGMDFLDTANVYGNGVSEQVIGAFLKNNPGSKFTIATKGGIHRPPGATTRTFDNSADYLRGALEDSLERLGLEYIDLYYIHRRDQSIPIEDVVETLVRFKEEGKIGGFGFSEISPTSLRRAHRVAPVTAVQSEYSLWTRQPELGMVQACRELGVTFVPFSPVGRGIFADNRPDPASFGKVDFRKNNPRFSPENLMENLKLVEEFKSFAADNGYTTAALSLAWILHQDDYMIPIPGTRSAAHLAQNAAASDIKLSVADLAEIDRILPVGFAWGDRYTDAQAIGTERYC